MHFRLLLVGIKLDVVDRKYGEREREREPDTQHSRSSGHMMRALTTLLSGFSVVCFWLAELLHYFYGLEQWFAYSHVRLEPVRQKKAKYPFSQW